MATINKEYENTADKDSVLIAIRKALDKYTDTTGQFELIVSV